MNDSNQQLEKILKEIQKINESQKVMEEKINKVEEIMKHIESDIYSDEDFDFEIVCPYCEYEFVIDIDENRKEIECPECKNMIELDWTGELNENNECLGNCHGCSGCEDNDEDDM